MKVLIFNVNAKEGSTGRICFGLYTFLMHHGHSVKVCYRGATENFTAETPDFIRLNSLIVFKIAVFFSRVTGYEGIFNYFATKKAIKTIRSFCPDVIQLYNVHGNYINHYYLLDYISKFNIPVVYTMLDEFPYMGKCAYPWDCEKFKEACGNCPRYRDYPFSWFFDQSVNIFKRKEMVYQKLENIIFTGPNYVVNRARLSKLLGGKECVELDEPFNFGSFYYREGSSLKKELGIKENDIVVISAPGTVPRKGGKTFLELANSIHDNNIKFIFIGYDRNDWSFPENVIVEGYIFSQDKLAEYLSIADVYVCTSVGDTTPSICLSALGCGTPILAFDYGGIKDCAPNEYGRYVPVGDVKQMANEVRNTRPKTSYTAEKISKYARERFSEDKIYTKQLELYKYLIHRS